MSAVDTAPRGDAEAPGDNNPPKVRSREDTARQVRLVVVFAVALALLLWWALSVKSHDVTYIAGSRVTKDDQPSPLDGTFIAWGSVVLAAGALVLAALNKFPKGWAGALIGLVVGLGFYLGFLVWVYADQTGVFQAAIANPLPSTVQLATPIIFGALAGCLCERAGVINIAIEGQFLAGAFTSSVVASIAKASWLFIPIAMCPVVGIAGGIIAGMLVASLLALFALRYQVNQVVLGVVLVTLATGLTAFLLGQIPGDSADKFNNPDILEPIAIPGLSNIPWVGELFNMNILVYAMYVSVGFVWFLLFQTRWGLRVRAVGEHPKAADTVGVKVNRARWAAVLLGGAFAGMGGAYYTVGDSGAFDRDMSAGQGFIALAAVIMGRWHPIGASFAALFFGLMLTLQDQLGQLGKVPTEFLGAAPYVATVIAVAGFVGRVRPPAADGVPYVKS